MISIRRRRRRRRGGEEGEEGSKVLTPKRDHLGKWCGVVSPPDHASHRDIWTLDYIQPSGFRAEENRGGEEGLKVLTPKGDHLA